MGSRMAANLRRAGFDVVVWNRTREKAEAVGGDIADTPAQAAQGAGAVITMVVDSPQVEQVLFGPDGAVDAAAPGTLFVDMSTVAPAASRDFAERLAQRDLAFLDAPVSGSSPKAEDGTLTIMVGGGEDDFRRALPLFEAMGSQIVHAGPPGHGSMVKLLNNSVAAITTAAIAEALEIADAKGVDPEKLVQVMKGGSAASLMLELKSRPMIDGDYAPLFRLAHMLKDVRHTLSESNGAFDLAEAAERLYAEADEAGHGDDDFAAVVEAVRSRRSAQS
jgi:3-hydroxyisobutyrate dehydrogenase-like beta-hydroxyacid dehydrogenase